METKQKNDNTIQESITKNVPEIKEERDFKAQDLEG
jgi:hypothetical protein